jgi:PepSY-associated TM region
VHFWVGAAAGAYLTLMSITGSIIVFRDQLSGWRSMEWLVKLPTNLLAGSVTYSYLTLEIAERRNRRLRRRRCGILVTQPGRCVLSGEQPREFLILETSQTEVEIQTLEVDHLQGPRTIFGGFQKAIWSDQSLGA